MKNVNPLNRHILREKLIILLVNAEYKKEKTFCRRENDHGCH